MKKIILFYICSRIVFACSLCTIDAPNVHVKSIIMAQNNKTDFEIEWDFNKTSIKALVNYDKNNDNFFDNNEIQIIKNDLINYLKTNNHLTFIVYQDRYKKDEKPQIYDIKVSKDSFIFNSTEMIYKYSFALPFVLEKDKRLALAYYDKGNNFNFVPSETVIENYNGTKIVEQNSNQLFIYLYNPPEK